MAEIRFTFFYIRWKKLGGSESVFSTRPKCSRSPHGMVKPLPLEKAQKICGKMENQKSKKKKIKFLGRFKPFGGLTLSKSNPA